MSRGVFVVFEGCEGAGKTTQLTRLADTLRTAGHDVVVTREPGATAAGAEIRQLLLHRRAGEAGLASRCETLLFAADRAQHVAELVSPALAAGQLVLCDRYIDSTLAYQGAGLGELDPMVEQVCWWAARDTRPDLTVLFDVPAAVGLARAGRRSAADTIEQRDLDFHERVRAGFLALAAADPQRHVVVDATLDPDQIAEQVRAAAAERLGARSPADGRHAPGLSSTDAAALCRRVTDLGDIAPQTAQRLRASFTHASETAQRVVDGTANPLTV